MAKLGIGNEYFGAEIAGWIPTQSITGLAVVGETEGIRSCVNQYFKFKCGKDKYYSLIGFFSFSMRIIDRN